MDASGHPEIFFFLFAMTVVWLILVAYLLYYLRTRQPLEFERLGRPGFQQGSLRLIGYLFSRGYRKVGDPTLSTLCNGMLMWFVLVQSLFLYLAYRVLTTPAGV